MADAVDETVLAAWNRRGQVLVEPCLAVDLAAEQCFGDRAGHRFFEGVDVGGGQNDQRQVRQRRSRPQLWLTDEERARLVSHVIAAIAAVRDNEASQQRKPYLLSPIMIPTESNAGP